MADNHKELLPPFISPLTHDQHARLGRIAILWGQIDMIVDQLLNLVLGISAKQRIALIGEKPLGAKLDILSGHFDEIDDPKRLALIKTFWDMASQTKSQRNRCFHGIWGYRTMPRKKITAAASHFKAGNNPVTLNQLPALERKLCKTARAGMNVLTTYMQFRDSEFSNRLFHGPSSDRPAWLEEWIEQHPVDDGSLDHRWKPGQLPYLKQPL